MYPEKQVMAICGDGGFMMNSQEMETAIRLKLNLVVLVLRDDSYGMIRWKQYSMGYPDYGLQYGNPDFVKLAESYGIKGVHIDKPAHCQARLKEALSYKGPVLIHAEVIKEDNVFPMIPAGKSAYQMIIEPPSKDVKLEKPTGST